MWCLETIVAINGKLAEGKSLGEAYVECGIRGPATEKIRLNTRATEKKEEKEDAPECGMRKPLPLRVVA